ncbi:MAG TPA: protein O-GlcNAcase [Bacillota bacterium]|nr:protein O-GlcNAcase [Bacillota bacterium]
MKVDIRPIPTYTWWGKELGTIGNMTLKGEVKYWGELTFPKERMSLDSLDVEVFLGRCPVGGLFDSTQQYLIEAEGYYIEIKRTMDQYVWVWITAKSPRGYYYAYLTWLQLMEQVLYEGAILDNPLIEIRGVVEGYYGKPWNVDERLRAFEILSYQKMNTYIYAPKQDRYHRDLWAVSYPQEEAENLTRLIHGCQKHFLDFVFAVSPGLSIRYSSVESINQLMGKYRQVYQLGVKFFGLFLDDIALSLYDEGDKRQFGELVKAQIFLIHTVYAQLKEMDSEIRFMVCPTQYYGEGNEEYIRALGRALPKEVDLIWTGRRICSPEITAREACVFYESTRHQALYWDNYPVNDANMVDEMHIGPLVNRDPFLFLYAKGLIANVMEYAEASLIPLITVAHYLWNSEAYHAQTSFSYAVRKIVGEKDEAAFMLLSDCINQSSISPLPGNEFMMKWFTFHQSWDQVQTQQQFQTLLIDYKDKAKSLLQMENIRLQKELRPWFEQAIQDFDFLLKILTLTEITDTALRLEAVQELRDWAASRCNKQKKVLGFFPQLIVSEILEKESL